MLQIRPNGFELWDSIMPEELKKLPEELGKVDEILNDVSVMEPFLKRFNTTMGRPTVPVYTYLRMMYLKSRYKMGYETMEKEVNDSITWRRFCGIPYDKSAPEASTIIKLTHKYGEDILKKLHEIIIGQLVKKKVIRGRKIRFDTTVVASDTHYPTDVGVMGDGLRRLRSIILKIKNNGLRIGRTLKKVKGLNFAINQLLRQKTKKAKEKVKAINGTVIQITLEVVKKVRKVMSRGKDRIKKGAERVADIVEKVAEQSAERLAGGKPEDRIVSIADPEARPIVKGKLDKPVEFGRTAELVQDEKGYVTQYAVHNGNPNDATLLPGIIAEHEKQFPEALREVAGDTGFASAENFELLEKAGVKHIGIPARGHPTKEEQKKQDKNWYKELRRFRPGIEACIRFLDRKFGFKRSMYRGNTGTAIWVGWSVVAANLYRYANTS